MLQVTVCIGSSCYLKGSWQVVTALQEALIKYGLESAVELKAGFCLGRCQQGVVVQIGEEVILGMQPGEPVDGLILNHILPEVTGR